MYKSSSLPELSHLFLLSKVGEFEKENLDMQKLVKASMSNIDEEKSAFTMWMKINDCLLKNMELKLLN